MSLSIDISVEAEGWGEEAELEHLARRASEAAQEAAGVELAPVVEVSLLFSDDARIRELNREWRGLDKPTNVLSFPAADADRLTSAPVLGDIALAYETVRRESDEQHKPFRDHLTHLIVHGFLHLVGFDHETSDEAEEMEELERRALARLSIADPYADTVPVDDEQR
jgi:probable rRNA maturation factor